MGWIGCVWSIWIECSVHRALKLPIIVLYTVRAEYTTYASMCIYFSSGKCVFYAFQFIYTQICIYGQIILL